MNTMEASIRYNPDLTQILNGEEILSPSPKTNHQRIARKLLRILDDHVGSNVLGEVFIAPLDVIFEEKFNELQPDLLFISNQNTDIIQDWILGVPDLTIEIVSRTSKRIDTVVKKGIYERYGVKEYWLVFPEKALIEVYALASGKLELRGVFTDQDKLKSALLSGLTFSVSAIFKF